MAEYLVDFNSSAAARRAGYSVHTAHVQGPELLAKPVIQAMVREHVAKLNARTDISAERVAKELAALGFSDMRDYVRFDERGHVVLDWSHMPDGATKAIAEITQDEYMDGTGDGARLVRRTKFKLHDKKGALDSLAKYLKMFADAGAPVPAPIVNVTVQLGIVHGLLADPAARRALDTLAERVEQLPALPLSQAQP